MLRQCFARVCRKAALPPEALDYVLSGDLLNQCVGSAYAMRGVGAPYLGLYGACSTMAEAVSLAAMLIDGGCAETAAALTSSHFCSAERQYRFPLEYGGQRTPTAQWTVTGSGAVILQSGGAGPYITYLTPGRIVDAGITDANNMGAAMAPAAFDTVLAVFDDTGFGPDDFDGIFSGDLGRLGSEILRDLCRERGIELGQRYSDCGEMIFSSDQECYSGGSGAGCSACVLNSFLLGKMHEHEYNRILLVATGALMSPTTSFQGESIPAICHGIILENDL